MRDILRIGLFVSALLLPLSALVFDFDEGPQLSENRRYAEMPKLILQPKELASFPGKFRSYFSDHFGFRSSLIHAYGLFCLRVFGIPSNHNVIIGRDGWLFLSGERSLDYYRRIDLFTDDQLEQWAKVLEERRDWLARRGAVYFFVVAPNKDTIYGEYMPELYTQVGLRSRLDQLMDYLRQHSRVKVIDLRPVLNEAKKHARLYHRTDTHWNDLGAFLAYQEVMSVIRSSVPGTQTLSRDDFSLSERSTNGMDLAGQLGLGDVFREARDELTPRPPLTLLHLEQNDVAPILVSSSEEGLPAAVVFRDSFFTQIVPWLANSFGRGAYYWQYDFDPLPIEEIRPKIVIQEIAERKLMTLVPRNPRSLANTR
jgi:hypothetical protein